MSTLTTSSKRPLDDALSSNMSMNSAFSNNSTFENTDSDINNNNNNNNNNNTSNDNNTNNNGTETTSTRNKKPTSKKSKQLDPEARLKRTQQNRAAQRAFRERKEKKMRELENKVNKLTEIQRQNEIESNFLRDQLNLLLLELKKYRPTTDNDLKVLNYLSQHNNNSNNSSIKDSSLSSSFSSSDTSNPAVKTSNITDITANDNSNWLDKLLSDNDLFTKQLFDNSSNNNKLDVTGDNSSSPLFFSNKYNDNQIISNLNRLNHNNNNNSSSSNNKDSLGPDGLLDFDNQFDEQVANFCVKMNQACGTKFNPIPKHKSSIFSGSSISTNTQFTDSVITNSPSSSASLSFISTPSTFSNTIINDNNNSNKNNDNNNNNNSDISASVPFMQYAKSLDINPFEIDTNKSGDSPQLTICSTDTSTSSNRLHNTANSASTDDNIKGKDDKSTFDLQFLSNDFKIPFINTDLAFPSITNDNELFFRDTNPLKGANTNNILGDFIDDEENVIYDNGIKIKQKLPTTLFNEVPYTVQLATNNNSNNNIATGTTKSGSVVDVNGDAHAPAADYDYDDDDDDDAEDGDPQVVPSKDDKMLKCSEIWDRITTHPKYSELDIDGLCAELMAKAKCSDRGVVVDADVVQDALTKHMQ